MRGLVCPADGRGPVAGRDSRAVARGKKSIPKDDAQWKYELHCGGQRCWMSVHPEGGGKMPWESAGRAVSRPVLTSGPKQFSCVSREGVPEHRH